MKTKLFRSRSKSDSAKASAPSTQPEVPSKVCVQKILVALDFSEGSRAALDYALTLAGSLQAELILLHVFEPVVPELKILESTFAGEGFRQQAEDELASWRSRVPPEFTVSVELRDGKPAHREILAAADQHKADLLVIGRSRGTGFERLLLGNTAKQVVQNAACAVLVAR